MTSTLGTVKTQEGCLKISVASDYALMLRGKFPVSPARTMFRRQVLEQVEGFDPTLTNSQDYDLCLRVAA